jgi:hypothetical protein
MKMLLTILLFTGIYGCLSAQVKPASDSSPDDCFRQYMVLKASGQYEESDKWMVRFAELRPNDLRAKDYQLYHSELQFLLQDNGNYTIIPLKYTKKLNDKMQGRTNIPKDGTFVVLKKRYAIRHSCLSSDGKTLYFDSDMTGGFECPRMEKESGASLKIWVIRSTLRAMNCIRSTRKMGIFCFSRPTDGTDWAALTSLSMP